MSETLEAIADAVKTKTAQCPWTCPICGSATPPRPRWGLVWKHAQCRQCSAVIGYWKEVVSHGSNRLMLYPFGGWLVLPLISLIVGTLCCVVVFVDQNGEAAEILRQRNLSGLLSDFQKYELVMGVAWGLFLIFNYWVAGKFLRRDPATPKAMIVLLVIGWLLSITSIEWQALIFDQRLDVMLGAMIVRSVVAAIWIMYFIYSKRVRATFTGYSAIGSSASELRIMPSVNLDEGMFKKVKAYTAHWAAMARRFNDWQRVLTLLVIVGFTFFVWPTPYRYDRDGKEYYCFNRITGTAWRLDDTGWRELRPQAKWVPPEAQKQP